MHYIKKNPNSQTQTQKACEALQNFINFDGLTTDFDPTLNGFEVVRQEQDLFGNVYNIYKNAEGITYTLTEILLILQAANAKPTKPAKVRKSKTSSAKQAKQKNPSDLIALNKQLQNNCETQITNHAEPPATEKKEVNKQTKLKRIVVNDALDSDLVIKSALLEKLNKSNKNSLNFAEVLECLKNLNIQDSNDIVTNIENIITNYKNIDTSKLSTKKLNGDYKFSFLALLMNRTEPITILRSGTYKTLLCNITATCFSGETKDYLNKYEEILKQENIIDNYSEEILNRKLEKAVADTTKNTKTLIDYLCLNAEDIKTIELQNNPPLQLTENQIKEIRSELAENTISNHAEHTINTQAQNAPINATSEVYSQPNINNNNSQNESIVKQQAKEKQTFSKPQKYNNLKKDFSDYEKTDDYYSFIANKLNEVGIIYDALDLSGKFVSCKTNDKQRKKNGRYIVHLTEFNTNAGENLFFGYLGYQNHATSEWLECKFTNYSKAEYKSNAEIESNIKHLLENIEIKRREVEKKRKQERETAAALATKIYNKSDIYTQHYTEENPHPYLKKKNLYTIINGVKIIKAEVVSKLVGDAYGKTNYKLFGSDGELKGDLLVIPIHNISGEFTSLQFIDINGNKSFLKDGAKSLFEITDNNPTFNNVAVAEGLATGASIKLALPTHKVFISFDAGNLSNVVGEIVKANSNAKITIFADNDKESHTGEIQAKKAIAENKNANIKYILTKGEVNDFNDRFADIFNAQQATKPLDKLKSAKDIFKDELESQLNEISKTSKTAGGLDKTEIKPTELIKWTLANNENKKDFPATELPDILQKIAISMTGTPPSLCYLTGIGAVATAIQPLVELNSLRPSFLTSRENTTLPASLFILCFAASSIGKNTATNELLNIFEERQKGDDEALKKLKKGLKKREEQIRDIEIKLETAKNLDETIKENDYERKAKSQKKIDELTEKLKEAKGNVDFLKSQMKNSHTLNLRVFTGKVTPEKFKQYTEFGDRNFLFYNPEALKIFPINNQEQFNTFLTERTDLFDGRSTAYETKQNGSAPLCKTTTTQIYFMQDSVINSLGGQKFIDTCIQQGLFARAFVDFIPQNSQKRATFELTEKIRNEIKAKYNVEPEYFINTFRNFVKKLAEKIEVQTDEYGDIEIKGRINFDKDAKTLFKKLYDEENDFIEKITNANSRAIYEKFFQLAQRLSLTLHAINFLFPFYEKNGDIYEDNLNDFLKSEIPTSTLKNAYKIAKWNAEKLSSFATNGLQIMNQKSNDELALAIIRRLFTKYEKGTLKTSVFTKSEVLNLSSSSGKTATMPEIRQVIAQLKEIGVFLPTEETDLISTKTDRYIVNPQLFKECENYEDYKRKFIS